MRALFQKSSLEVFDNQKTSRTADDAPTPPNSDAVRREIA